MDSAVGLGIRYGSDDIWAHMDLKRHMWAINGHNLTLRGPLYVMLVNLAHN